MKKLVTRGELHATALAEYDELFADIHGKYLSSMISIDGCDPVLNAVIKYILAGTDTKKTSGLVRKSLSLYVYSLTDPIVVW